MGRVDSQRQTQGPPACLSPMWMGRRETNDTNQPSRFDNRLPQVSGPDVETKGREASDGKGSTGRRDSSAQTSQNACRLKRSTQHKR